jgi:uncharacterized protein YjgD (DUF1641 family)
MNELEINNRFDEINAKLDMVLQYVEIQRRKSQEIEDLVDDVKIVGYDMYNTIVEELDHNNIELNPEELKMLVLKLTKNVSNLNQMMGVFESMNDLIKDLGPIIHDLGLNTIETIAEWEKKGYFETVKNLADNMDNLLKIAVNFSDPQLIKNLEKISKVIASTKTDIQLDNKSMFGLYRELKSPEVRQTLAYSLRLVKEIKKELDGN